MISRAIAIHTLGLRIYRKKIAKFKTANIFVGGSTAKLANLNARQYFRVYCITLIIRVNFDHAWAEHYPISLKLQLSANYLNMVTNTSQQSHCNSVIVHMY